MIYNIIIISGEKKTLHCIVSSWYSKQTKHIFGKQRDHRGCCTNGKNGTELCWRSACLWMRRIPVGLRVHVRRGFSLLSHVALQLSRSSSSSSNVPQCRPADFITLLPDSRSDCVRPCDSLDWNIKSFSLRCAPLPPARGPASSRASAPLARVHVGFFRCLYFLCHLSKQCVCQSSVVQSLCCGTLV